MSLLLETCIVPVLGSTYKVNIIESHCLLCHMELFATPMGQGVAFEMISGVPLKFMDLNPFVSAEYHLLQMIFSRDCYLQNNYFHRIHQFLPPGQPQSWPWPGQCLCSWHLHGDATASTAQGWPQPGCLGASGIPSLLSLFWTENLPLPTPPRLSLGHGWWTLDLYLI